MGGALVLRTAGLITALVATGLAGVSGLASVSAAAPPVQQDTGCIALDGNHLTIDQVVAIARSGVQVSTTPESTTRVNANYRLLLDGAKHGIPIYWFNRKPGAGREEWVFKGDPMTPENRAFIGKAQLDAFRKYAQSGVGPEVADPAIVRATMVVHLNTILHGGNAASPQLLNMLTAFINKDVTPVIRSRGAPGLGDLNMMRNVGGTMIGLGDAYYRGVRMSAKDALAKAGLKPLEPFGADDSALTSTNAYSVGQMALMLSDAHKVLQWQDLAFAMDMEGMNSSVTPLVSVTQHARPFPDQMDVANRVLDMLRGSYLFEPDSQRIVQDPESFRDTSQRNGSAWTALHRLESDVLLQMNSSDHNPTTDARATPSDWALNTPWVKQYYVDGADLHGYVLSNANFDPIALDNDIEAFNIAMAQMAAATALRPQRFTDTFFTVIKPADVLPADVLAKAAPIAKEYDIADIFAEIQSLANPVPAQGNAIVNNVEDLQAFSRQKVVKAGQIVDDMRVLISEELLTGSYWMNVRAAQAPGRQFGKHTTAAWNALRTVIPWQADDRPAEPPLDIVMRFISEHPADSYTN